MKVDDLEYFKAMESGIPRLTQLAHAVESWSSKDRESIRVFKERINELSRLESPTAKNEAGRISLKKHADFIAELIAYAILKGEGLEPLWIGAQVKKRNKPMMPDLAFLENGSLHPAEVKQIGTPDAEHEMLFHGAQITRPIDPAYDVKLPRKIRSLLEKACGQLESYYGTHQNSMADLSSGRIYLFFQRSMDAMLNDLTGHGSSMNVRVKNIANEILAENAHGPRLFVLSTDDALKSLDDSFLLG